jgi:hypothetical protein
MVSVDCPAEVPVTTTDEGDRVHVAPTKQAAVVYRLTVPENPLTDASVIVAVAVCPAAGMLIVAGVDDRVKSGAVTITGADSEGA